MSTTHQHQANTTLWTQRFEGHPYRPDWEQTTYTTPVGVMTMPTVHSANLATDLYTIVELTEDRVVYQWYATATMELVALLANRPMPEMVDDDD